MTDYFSLDSYDYYLPDERIAQEPMKERGTSRLLVLSKDGGIKSHSFFSNLKEHLPEGTLLVANNSRVVPARLVGRRETGGKVEMLLMTPAPLLQKMHDSINEIKAINAKRDTEDARKDSISKAKNGAESEVYASVLLKPSRSIKVGMKLYFAESANPRESRGTREPRELIVAKVLSKGEFGQHEVSISWQGDLVSCLERAGSLPLPPYIKRPEGPNSNDISRYQTIYAKREQSGSVAAPTAGLHFSSEIKEDLLASGIEWAELTLHVGYGTFSPVRENDIRKHHMHSEYIEISEDTCTKILKAKAENRPIITVGTTASRSLEGMFKACGHIPKNGWQGQSNIFMYPGYEFQVIDGLITNFHLPKSSLLMLVCAFAGYENTFRAYKEAVEQEYRFFSYGDAMLIY